MSAIRTIGADRQFGYALPAALIVSGVGLLGLIVVTGRSAHSVAPVVALGVVLAATHRTLLQWRYLVTLIVLVILLIPMKRYSLPGSLPIKLEPYRLLVALVAACWISSLLIDPRVRLRRTPIDRPLGLFALAVLGSDVANRARVASVQPVVIKTLLFFLSFFIVLYLVASVVRRFEHVDFVTRVLVAVGSAVALLALVERKTGYNAFDHLGSIIPFLHLDASQVPHITRGGHLRVFASAQHPIALSAALTMLVPLGIYRAQASGRRRWWAAVMLLTLGAMVTGSRTGIVMIGVIAATYLFLRPAWVRRLWPAFIPALLIIHLAAPGSLGTIRASFFPKGGLVAQQTDQSVGSGRLATLGPALAKEFRPNPILGEGFGTRITTQDPGGPKKNAPILDDQWLGIVLETGVVGALSLAWLFTRFIRRLLPAARDDESPRGWFLVGVIASVASFAASMLFYDAFSFTQVTFVLFIIMGLGISALLATEPSDAAALETESTPLLRIDRTQLRAE